MAKTIITLMTAVVAFSLFGGKDALSMELNQFQWKNRLLFLFAPEHSNSLFSDLQSEIVAQKNGVQDRDLVVFEIIESGPSFMNTTRLDVQMAATLRKQFDVSPGRFTVILVGKDGGVKLKRHTRIKLNDIFALIDAMPMRQEEMRQKDQ